MDNTIMSAIVGFFGAILGAVIGGRISAKASIAATNINIEAQNKLVKEQREIQEKNMKELISYSAGTIYLDILTALHQGFKILKNTSDRPILIPINQEYSKAIATISSEMDAKELILINKVYGIIEKIRYDIINCNYLKDTYFNIEYDYDLLEMEVFKDKQKDILEYDANMITYDYLLNELSSDYKIIFKKLEELSGIHQGSF